MLRQKATIYWAFLFLFFAAIFFFNIDGWLMHDDEGTDFYEVWQLQQGQQPGVDYIAEQQPLFLISGSTIVDIWGKAPNLLRLLAAVQVLAGAFILGFIIRYIWNDRIGLLAAGLILTSGLVYEQARLFRPDPMMLAWEMIGLGCVLLAVKTRQNRYWLIGGACYGMAFLWKPFGLFPIAGLGFYFLYWLLNSHEDRLAPIKAGLYFAVPFLIVGGGIALILYGQLGFYYGEPLSQHSALGDEVGFPALAIRMVLAYLFFFLVNAIFLFLGPLWLLNRPKGWFQVAEHRLLFWQLISPVIFVFVTRPLHIRYFFHLTPVFAILLAYQLNFTFEKFKQARPTFGRFAPIMGVVILLASGLMTRPNIPELLLRQETGTIELANYIQANTRPDQLVVADYAGLNFFADRASIYEASIIAGAQIEGGVVTADLLIGQLEVNDVEMVIVHVEGGDPSPHQLIELAEYDKFQGFINQEYFLATTFDRAGQQLEVYRRK